MRGVRSLLAALTLGLVCDAAAQEAVTENPSWIRRPDATLFAMFYPPEALAQEVEGRVVLDCVTQISQRPVCSARDEKPGGWGFGPAAVAMSRSFRLAPGERNGAPFDGARVRVPITFRLMDGGATPSLPMQGELDLPVWDAAPTPAAVRAASPDANLRGRGVLSCTVNEDRTLACAAAHEAPEGSGLAAAALTLAPSFSVSNEDFASRHRQEPFLLPINFGFQDLYMPVNRVFDGRGVWRPPPIPSALSFAFYPETAHTAREEGDVTIACVVRTAAPPRCSATSETNPGHGLGDAAVELVGQLAPMIAEASFLSGEQMEFVVQFRLEPSWEVGR